MFSMKNYGFITDIKTRTNNVKHRSYVVWSAMIHRCYNNKAKPYGIYGAKGVYVCEEWKIFSNFARWYDENYVEGYVIDKDISGKGYYGPDSCIFVSVSDNIREAVSRRDNVNLYSGDNNPACNTIEHYETNDIIRENFKRLCRKRGYDFNNFEEVYSGNKTKTMKRYFYIQK